MIAEITILFDEKLIQNMCQTIFDVSHMHTKTYYKNIFIVTDLVISTKQNLSKKLFLLWLYKEIIMHI